MRIVFLASWFPSRVHPTHGNFVAKHARLVAKEHDLSVLNIQDDPAMPSGTFTLEERQEDGYILYQLYYGQAANAASWRKIWLRCRAWNALREAYEKAQPRPDCLHAHVLLDAGIYAAWLGRRWGLPFLLTEHSTAYWSTGALPGIRGLLGRWACRRAAAILPVTPALGRAMQAHGFAGPYGSVSNVVDAQLFHHQPAPPRPPFVFLHVSNFRNWHKNVSGLVRAFQKAAEQSEQELILHLAGDGDLDALKKLLDYRSSKGSERAWPLNIRLSGELTEAQVAQLMQQSHAFLLFSNVENQPVVLLEALCCGRPCIATEVGGIADLLDEKNGIIVAPGDEAALTKAILHLVANYEHYDQARISQKAANQYGEAAILKAFTQAYQKATDQ